jgi:hypothetical protein
MKMPVSRAYLGNATKNIFECNKAANLHVLPEENLSGAADSECGSTFARLPHWMTDTTAGAESAIVTTTPREENG